VNPRGFTLVEVLVALAVVALGSAAVMTALSTGTQSTARLRERSYAEWVALNRMAEIRVAREWPLASNELGEETMAGQRWQWRQTIERSDVRGVWRIRVEARLAGAAGADDWIATVHGARGDDLASLGRDDAIWDTAARSAP
jgi:general secretion pathway protein I